MNHKNIDNSSTSDEDNTSNNTNISEKTLLNQEKQINDLLNSLFMPFIKIVEDTQNQKESESIRDDPVRASTNIYVKNNKNNADEYSESGDIKKLQKWFASHVDKTKVKNVEQIEKEYTNNAVDKASNNGHIEVLEWWYKTHEKYNIAFKYSNKAYELIGNTDDKYIEKYITVLEWWSHKNKFNNNPDIVTSWLRFMNKDNQEDFIKMLEWYHSKKLRIAYKFNFVDYIRNAKLDKVKEYLIKSEMIPENMFIPKNPQNIFGVNANKQFMPFKINNFFPLEDMDKNKKSVLDDLDTSILPNDVLQHIKDKEKDMENSIASLANGKTKEYLDHLIKIPFGKYKEEKIFKFVLEFISYLNTNNNLSLKNEADLEEHLNSVKDKYYDMYLRFKEYRKDYLKYVDSVFEKAIYGQLETKRHLKAIIAQWLSTGMKSNINAVFGLEGPPGVGKTTVIKTAFSQCLVDFIDYNFETCEISKVENLEFRPFCFISLGGSTNGSTLVGHNITYHGSTYGDIVKGLMQSKYMNPIIYFDELDKISKTEHGHEISSVLTHITDPVQNEHFVDRYFSEVKIDLSKCILVFSYNDGMQIDRILNDRIQTIKVKSIPTNDKVHITKEYIIPKLLESIGYNKIDLLSDEGIKELIETYTYEAGVRKLKEKLQEIIRKEFLDSIEKEKLINFPLKIKDVDNILFEHPKMNLKKVNKDNKVGCMNGLYATSNGLGDIMHIQVKKTYNKEVLGLVTTGSLEKVISESMSVAKSVAWNLLTEEEQTTIINSYEKSKSGIHIHCPDGATSKDGPSAGGAITLALYSLFTNKPLPSTIAMTGEIDLDGNITQIGGLDAKLNGAKRAGVKKVYVPEENKRDVEIVKKRYPEIVKSKMKIMFVSNIGDVVQDIFG